MDENSDETFELGPMVTVVMSRNDHFPWQTAPHFPATLVRASRGAGDTFSFLVEIEAEDGGDNIERIIEINGNSAEFVGYHYEAGPSI
ncbi:MAG: hypothetical protein KAJ42_17415 [Gemmatimonadetes bacterium]|nr:hypothetical protein [Gemmatimonadota bacterium]